MRKVNVVIGSIGVVVALGIGMTAFFVLKQQTPQLESQLHMDSSLIDTPTLKSLDYDSLSNADTSHLIKDMTPPTNKWYSGMVLNKESRPGFSVPNSILLHNDGFELGLPTITSSSEGIYGPHTNGIQLQAKQAGTYKLSRYDELTITLTYYAQSGVELFDVTFASGSPYGFVTAKKDVEVTLQSGTTQEEAGGLTTFKNGNAWYGAKSSTGNTGAKLSLQENDELAIFSASKQSDITGLAAAAKNRITSGKVSYSMQKSRIKTTLTYDTKNNEPTVLAAMPHQQMSSASNFTYPSLYGDLKGFETKVIEYTQPTQKLEWSLPLSTVSSNERAVLVSQLKSDIANSKTDKTDTYFGGKQLQRLAQLVMVADSLGDTEQREETLKKLTPALTSWFDSDDVKSFYYDDTAKAIVGREASFGSDKELNDHHFHYGYFIYAASVVAKFDKSFLDKYKNQVNLLTADIANYKASEALPLRRNFDAYAGHSWASGIANYGDGNNQESSGEAVNAWTAVGLWGDITKNDALRSEANWLLANEVAAAKAYWLSQPENENYTSPLVSINWGGKREYKTFFSDEPNAKLAIQLLPLNPTMQPYISQIPNPVFDESDVSKQYGDYILMANYGQGELNQIIHYADSLIDDGNSKAYMMAYVLSGKASR